MKIRVYIDGDGCNAHSRALAERLNDRGVQVVLVSNHTIKNIHPNTKVVLCPQEEDAADQYILSQSKEYDAVITRDLFLAQGLFAKYMDKIFVLSDNGEAYSSSSIDARIKRSFANKNIRALSQESSLNAKKSKKQKSDHAEFSNNLEMWRLQALKRIELNDS